MASSWVSRRAQRERAQASSLYLFFYYIGSSVGGTIGGLFWGKYGWLGVAGFVGLFIVLGIVGTLTMSQIPNVQVTSEKEGYST
ncbi:hypothetical protein [Alicyclobacillus dauci]|uniref:Major facilitator superfamily (MFS) profile domain-containing protein n=1 Tax=Alicyclobacillus dauci TaxID=1475485 RepID=A0ABY6YZF5_9BACL|nr:hypothetical protein [Alicyclobacillus dauci]WAH36004.1 hypothetical protein NZD86_17335 [Alicyclobacillus dauci]